jgi:hypothetical protein
MKKISVTLQQMVNLNQGKHFQITSMTNAVGISSPITNKIYPIGGTLTDGEAKEICGCPRYEVKVLAAKNS